MIYQVMIEYVEDYKTEVLKTFDSQEKADKWLEENREEYEGPNVDDIFVIEVEVN